MITGQEPELPGLRDLSGQEPELSNQRPKCQTCEGPMYRAGERWVCNRWECMRKRSARGSVKPARQKLDTDPKWFNAASSNVGLEQIRNARAGLHPTGSPLSNVPNQTCGNCMFCVTWTYAKSYHKCNNVVHRQTGGYSTDMRKSWPACALWQSEVESGE